MVNNGDVVWTVVEVDASQLERDTRGDVEVPALAQL
jgi:hypothetical protein